MIPFYESTYIIAYHCKHFQPFFTFFEKNLGSCKYFLPLHDPSILEKILKVFSYFNQNIANFELLLQHHFFLNVKQSAQHMKTEQQPSQIEHYPLFSVVV